MNDGGQGAEHAGESPETDGADEGASAVDLPLDQVFEILKNERRRTVLRYLNEHEGTVALGDLAEEVAAVENDTTVAQVTSRERKCAYVGLYQCHLPKMDDVDVVDFNQDRGRVEVGPNADRLEQYLDWEETDERPWPLYYGTLSAAGTGLVALTVLLGGILTTLASLASLAAVGGLAAFHAASADE